MRQLSEEDIIKRDCNIYKTKHFLVMKNIYICSSTLSVYIYNFKA